MQIFDREVLKQDWPTTKLFDGKYGGFQRYDTVRYPVLRDLTKILKQNFWIPEEINLSRDKVQFMSLPPHHQEAFRRNLLFQTVADSVQSRGLELSLATRITDPILESLNVYWAMQEINHSESYSHIVQSMFSDASAFFDSIDDHVEIKNRFVDEVTAYENIGDVFLPALFIRILVLESLKFMVSFCITYGINATNDEKLPGSTKIIKLIDHDEKTHVAISAHILRIGKKDPSELSTNSSDCWEQMAGDIFKEAVEKEMAWYDYLSEFIYDIPILSRDMVKGFLMNRADKTMKLVGWDPVFNIDANELTGWHSKYSNINKQVGALQETENLGYSFSKLINDF
jgi:ribonucleoside-diphosphate reductase beta chain